MNTFSHQWKWDFRRIRCLWLGWMLLLVAASFGSHFTAFNSGPVRILGPMFSLLQGFVIFLLAVLLVARVMYTTPLAGSNAYWKTLPMSWRALFWTKTTLIIVLIWLPVVVAKFAVWQAANGGARFMVWGTLNYAALYFALLFTSAFWAARCERMSSFAVGVASTGAWAGLCAIVFAMMAQRMDFLPIGADASDAGSFHSTTRASTFIASLLIVALTAGVAWLMILSRRGRGKVGAIIVLAGGIALATTAGRIWRVDFLSNSTGAAVAQVGPLTANVLESDAEPGDAQQLLWAELALDVPPGQFVVVDNYKVSLSIPESGAHWMKSMDESQMDWLTSAAQVLAQSYPAGTRMLTPDVREHRALFEHHADGQRGILEGTMQVSLYKWKKLASLPLRIGARSKRLDAGITSIVGLREEGGNVRIDLASVLPPRDFRVQNAGGSRESYRMPLTCVLYDPKSGRAVLGEEGSSGSMGGASFWMDTETLSLEFHNDHLGVGSRGTTTMEGLPEARLDLYSKVKVGISQFQFRQEDWTVYSSRKLKHPADLILPALTVEDLPENPSAAEVDSYLDSVLFTIPQNLQGPQWQATKARLLATGTEHLDRLIHRLPVGQYAEELVFRVIRELIEEQHRPLLLSALEREPALASIALRRGWQDGAVVTLAARLRHHVPLEWRATPSVVVVVAGAKDPDTYDDLKWHFVHGSTGHRAMAKALRLCPEFPLEEAIGEAWNLARYEPWGRRHQLAVLAARLGDREALRQAYVTYASQEQAEDQLLLEEIVDCPEGEILRDWIHAKLPELAFNKERKRWELQP